jgi:hypothetical protein
MESIFEAAKSILEGKVEYSPKQLQDTTKVLLSLGCSYDDINEVRTASKKGGQTVDALIKLCGLVAGNQSAFNSIFAKKESVEEVVEDTLTEEIVAKLKNDVASLKKIGWSLDKITKKLITSTEYGKGVTSDIIASLFSPPKPAKPAKASKDPMWPPVTSKSAPPFKRPKWPSNPKGRQVKDTEHATNFTVQAMQAELGESPDISWEEAEQLLSQAGYAEATITAALNNLGLHPAPHRMRPMAKKAAKKREDV